MKKTIFLTSITLLSLFCYAQSAYDALRYSTNFYVGTARSAAMGNAVTALGGDFGSLSINPAGSAVFPYSEFVFTPALNSSITKSDYLGNTSKESYGRLGISNIGYIGSMRFSNYGGLTGITFGIGYNAVNNFTDRFSASGDTGKSSWLASLAYQINGVHAKSMDDTQNPFYTTSAPWKAILAWNSSLLDTIPGCGGKQYVGATEAFFGNDITIPGNLKQNYSRKSVGNVGEYVINLGLNFSNRLFLGANLGIQSIYYETNEQYNESVVNKQEFWQTEFNHFTHTYRQTTTGVGVNFKLGLIYLPMKDLRFGASISTPTWMSLNEEWEESIDANFSDGYHQYLQSPIGQFKYRINAPFRWNLGIAYTFGNLGAVSFDYEQVAYNKIFMSSTDYNNPFVDENAYMKREYQNCGNVRAGLEINLNSDFSLRGGYAFYGNPEKSYGSHTQIVSMGIGMHAGSFFSDLTFLQRFPQKEYFALYDDVREGTQIIYQAPVGLQTTSNWKLLLSMGFRF